MRRKEAAVVVCDIARVEHPIRRRRKSRLICTVLGTVMAETLQAIQNQAQVQHLVIGTVVDRYTLAEQRKGGQACKVRQAKDIETAIGCGEDGDIEKGGIPIAMKKPAFHCALKCEIAHAVSEQICSIAIGARRTEKRFKVGEECHKVQARLSGHELVVPVVCVQYWETDYLPK